jgi:hypothetical protein
MPKMVGDKIPQRVEDEEDFRDLTEGRYTVMPVSDPPTPRKGTVDRLEEMPHRKRTRAASASVRASEIRKTRTMTGWRRSARGNLCRTFGRKWRGVVIRPTESSHKQEFSYLIGDNETELCEFSPQKFPTEEAAFHALVSELEARGICG